MNIRLNVKLTLQKVYSTLMSRLLGPPIYHLSGNVIFATVGFVYINLQPNMNSLAQLVSDNSRSLEKFKLVALSCQATPK